MTYQVTRAGMLTVSDYRIIILRLCEGWELKTTAANPSLKVVNSTELSYSTEAPLLQNRCYVAYLTESKHPVHQMHSGCSADKVRQMGGNLKLQTQ